MGRGGLSKNKWERDWHEHHARYRFAWALLDPDGSTAVTGLDIGILASDGRIGDVVGFFGELTPL